MLFASGALKSIRRWSFSRRCTGATIPERSRSLSPSRRPQVLRRPAANWQASDGVIGSLSLSPEEWLALKDAFRNAQAMAAHFHRNGVLLTAGSDVGGWLAPGVSFHRELQLLRDAGIDGIDVLRIATLNGAEAMGLEAELGSVEEGKLADLVVLAASPVEDMSNSSLIEAIYLGGVQLTPKELFGN